MTGGGHCDHSAGQASVATVDTLGDDLVLLSIRSDGVIGTAAKLRFGLSGAELVRLAALRRIDIERGRIVVLDQGPTGDVLLDEALISMADGRRAPKAKAWVAHPRGDLPRRYLERLAHAGTVRAEHRNALGFIPKTRWTILDSGRLASARARLDAIADGSGGIDSEQAALAGLASAIGLPSLIYPGFAGRAARKRVEAAGHSGGPAAHATKAAADAAGISAANDVAMHAAVAAATDAATRAATAAAVQASIDAATAAAVSAATEAAHHAASDAGTAAGGHH
jgi:hypothetical protein